MHIYEPLRKLDNIKSSGHDQVSLMTVDLAGRNEEMSRLEQVCKNWQEGSGALVVITAPSGYGKSALGNASRAEVAKLDSVITWYNPIYSLSSMITRITPSCPKFIPKLAMATAPSLSKELLTLHTDRFYMIYLIF